MRKRYLPDRVRASRLPGFFLGLFIAGLVASFALTHPLGLLGIWLGLLSISILTSQVPARSQLYVQGVLLLFASLSSLPLAIDTLEPNDIYVLRLGHQMGITEASLSTYKHVLLRCMAASSASLLLLYTIPIFQLSRILKQIRLPRLFVELFDLTYRYIFILLELADQIFMAMKIRFAFERRQDLLPHSALLLGQTLLIAHKDAMSSWQGLLSRQYDEDIDRRPIHVDQLPTTPHTHHQTMTHELKDIYFAYEEESPILCGLNFEIRDHPQVIQIEGDNGAGKSTLFYVLAGILRPTQGLYLTNGCKITYKRDSLRRLRRSVGLVLQNSNHQLFTASVEDEIAFGLRNIGMDKAEISHRVEKQIKEYDLGLIRHKPPHLLSEGQKKWVALAAVLILEPQVIILDEPTASLDNAHALEIPRLISRLYHAGHTIIVAMHDDHLPTDIPIRKLIIRDGILQKDSPDQ